MYTNSFSEYELGEKERERVMEESETEDVTRESEREAAAEPPRLRAEVTSYLARLLGAGHWTLPGHSTQPPGPAQAPPEARALHSPLTLTSPDGWRW